MATLGEANGADEAVLATGAAAAAEGAPEATPPPQSTLTTEKKTRTATTESKTWDGEYPPLTTPWTMPDTCGFTMDLDNPPSDGRAPTVTIDWIIEPGATTFSCYPPGMFEASNSGTFSPANCPLGWTTVDSQVSTIEKVRTRTCCSKDYTVSDSMCQKVETGVVRPTGVRSVSISGTDHYTYVAPGSATTPITGATLAHHMVVILLEKKDQDILGVTDEDIFVSDSGDAPGAGGRGDGRLLSLGAKLGIGIGAATALSLLVLAAVWLVRRRRHRRLGSRKSQPYELGGLGAAGRRRTGAAGGTAAGAGNGTRRPSCDSSDDEEDEEDTVVVGPAPLAEVEPDPPPAYEPSPSQVSLEVVDTSGAGAGVAAGPGSGGSGGGAGTGVRTPEDELRVLKAQQETIQRRIDVLERGAVVPGGSEDGDEDGPRRSIQSRDGGG